jgi:hypothetical protein
LNKLLVIISICLVSYFFYAYVINTKTVLQISAHKTTTMGYSMDINAPPLERCEYGAVQGTIKNLSNKVVKNIVLEYKLNTEQVQVKIDQLSPGEVKNFSTQNVALRNSEVTFSLEEKSYE